MPDIPRHRSSRSVVHIQQLQRYSVGNGRDRGRLYPHHLAIDNAVGGENRVTLYIPIQFWPLEGDQLAVEMGFLNPCFCAGDVLHARVPFKDIGDEGWFCTLMHAPCHTLSSSNALKTVSATSIRRLSVNPRYSLSEHWSISLNSMMVKPKPSATSLNASHRSSTQVRGTVHRGWVGRAC